jgi:hypothetical protein
MIYSIADPENPQFLGTAKYQGSDGIPYGLGWNMVVTDTDVFVSTWSITYLLGGQNDVKYQTGDLIAIDVSDPTAPVFVSALRNTYGTTNDGIGQFLNVDNSGGDGNLWEVVQVDANTLLVAGSTAAGDDTQTGSGVVLVVDISDPAHMTIVRTVVIPGTTAAVGLSIDGNRAFVTGSQGGWSDLSAVQDFTGNTVLAVLDVTDPRNPTILGSQVLNRASAGVTTLRTTPLGNGLFTFSSLGTPQDQPVLYVVDSSDPTNLVTSRTTIPAFTANLDGFGNFLYVTSSSGLIIYQIDAPDATPVTARVSIPHSGGVALVPGSFSIDPTQVIAGADFDTYIWNLSLSAGETTRTITWQTTVTGLQSGQTRTIAIDPSVTFTALGTTDDIDLPPLPVVGEQILGLDPGSRSARPGEAASFTLHVSNPTNAPVTYNLAIQGVSSDWLIGLPATVTLGPHATATLPFSLRSQALAALADYGFAITATTPGGVSGSVQGLLTLVGLPLQPDTEAHGISVQLIPTQASAGQGTRANYIVRLTNTGSGLESYTMALQGLPSNVTAEFLTSPV